MVGLFAQILKISVIAHLYMIVREKIFKELGTIIVGHRRNVVNNYLIIFRIHIVTVPVAVMIVHDKIDVVAEYRRAPVAIAQIPEKLIIHFVYHGADCFI